MYSIKRIKICTIMGIICGIICDGFYGFNLPFAILIQVITSRTLIGFSIGISSLNKIPWFLHGPLFGVIFSTPLAFSALMAPATPEFSPIIMIFGSIFIMGAIYGFLTELVASVIFKAKIIES